MNVPPTPRPHQATQRPTQAYYVPRKVLECGRGNTKNDQEVKKTQQNKPKPLMAEIIEPPASLKEKQIFDKPSKPAPKQKGNNNNNNNNKKKSIVKAPTTDWRKSTTPPPSVTSSPYASSRSSSSASQVSPPVKHKLATLTSSTPRVINTPTNNYTLPRPNAFCPDPLGADECGCDRPQAHVVCKRCGFEFIGRVQRVCSQHPLILGLNDARECAECSSIQLVELQLPTELQTELENKIEKIDLSKEF